MSEIVRRGYLVSDETEFGSKSIEKLHKAGHDLYYLLNQGYSIETLDNVITSDAIILDKCKSWINLNKKIIESNIYNYTYVDFS